MVHRRKISARKKRFRGSCVDNPFNDADKLRQVIDNATEISKRAFLRAVDIQTFRLFNVDLKEAMRDCPHDFTYWRNKNIYFFVHSAIEHFFW